MTYRELIKHQDELEAEDPLEAIKNLGERMKKARSEPEEIFLHLPDGSKRAVLIEGASMMSTTRATTFIPHPPLFRAEEVPLWGGLWFQKIFLDISPAGAPTRSVTAESAALVGSKHLVHEINFLDQERGFKIDDIVRRHPYGETALKIRERQFRSS